MATFLQLCQAVALESGTVPTANSPSTVTGQTGRLARIVAWVNRAYSDIQNDQDNWGWLWSDFTAAIPIGSSFTPASLGLTRWASWDSPDDIANWTIYLNTDGIASETWLVWLPYDQFRQMFLLGIVPKGRPGYVSIKPSGEIILGPVADADYTLRGRYMKSPQVLAVDADTPEMPARFHDAILWKALIYLGTFDESMAQIPNWNAFLTEKMTQLRSNQLPEVTVCGPFA